MALGYWQNNILMPFLLPVAINYGGTPDKHRGLLITTSLEGCTHQLADVVNRVHTRHYRAEDVRGNACKKAIAWKALPWSFHYVTSHK